MIQRKNIDKYVKLTMEYGRVGQQICREQQHHWEVAGSIVKYTVGFGTFCGNLVYTFKGFRVACFY